ncbi:MAG: hypothetical protein HY720_08795 [Planctomycetes bacterium]|nr:hypothetical protein [Planctomycetota bacterium]
MGSKKGARREVARAKQGDEEAIQPLPGSRGHLREIRRQRIRELAAEVLAEAARHEREASRSLAALVAAGGALSSGERRGPEPSRRMARELSARQEKVLELLRSIEPFEARSRELPGELRAAGLALEPARRAVGEGESAAGRAAGLLAKLVEEAALVQTAGSRAQTAAVNLALEACRDGGEDRGWVDHAERIRSLAASASDEARSLAELAGKTGGEVRAGMASTGEAVAALSEVSLALADESSRAARFLKAAGELRARLARIRDDCLVQALLVHELGEIEEAARLDEERGRELAKVARAALSVRTLDPVTRAIERSSEGPGFAAEPAALAAGELRAGIEGVRQAAAEHERQVSLLAQVQTDLVAGRRHQARVVSAFPEGTEALASRLREVAGTIDEARKELGERARRVEERCVRRISDVAGRIEETAAGLRRSAAGLERGGPGAGAIGRAALQADLFVAVARLAGSGRSGGLHAALEAVEEGAREAAAGSGRAAFAWRAAEADLSRAALFLEQGAAAARAAGARIEASWRDLVAGEEPLATLGSGATELAVSLGAATDWTAETLQAVEEASARASETRRAAEEGVRSHSALRLALRGLEASADELEHLASFL